MAYLYLKHAQIPQKYIVERVLSEGSTAQNGQKVFKIAKIHLSPPLKPRGPTWAHVGAWYYRDFIDKEVKYAGSHLETVPDRHKPP